MGFFLTFPFAYFLVKLANKMVFASPIFVKHRETLRKKHDQIRSISEERITIEEWWHCDVNGMTILRKFYSPLQPKNRTQLADHSPDCQDLSEKKTQIFLKLEEGKVNFYPSDGCHESKNNLLSLIIPEKIISFMLFRKGEAMVTLSDESIVAEWELLQRIKEKDLHEIINAEKNVDTN